MVDVVAKNNRESSPSPKRAANAAADDENRGAEDANGSDQEAATKMSSAAFAGIGAIVVGILSVLVGLARSSLVTSDEIGTALFSLVSSEVTLLGVPTFHFRYAVHEPSESRISRTFFATCLAAAALANGEWRPNEFGPTYGLLLGSYVLVTKRLPGPAYLTPALASIFATLFVCGAFAYGYLNEASKVTAGAACGCFLASIWPTLGYRRLPLFFVGLLFGALCLPYLANAALRYLLPIEELEEAFELLSTFVGATELLEQSKRLFFITALTQVSLGFVGINFIRQGQYRKNALIYVGDRKETARGFTRLVCVYMVTIAFPYMMQRTVMENINGYAHGAFARKIERSIRLRSVFPALNPDSTEVGATLLAAVDGSKYTMESYTDAFNSVADVAYGVVEHKLFMLPKLLFLPGMLWHRPLLVVSVLPFSVGLEVGRTKLISSLTKKLEKMSREIQELVQRRRKIEQHDTKHEELIRRGGVSAFAQAQWSELATELEGRSLRFSALHSFRAFINGLYRQDFLMPGIEIALAWLLEAGHMASVDIWVYQRVVEDSMSFLLTRFRMDASLATMRTNMDRVDDLSARLEEVTARGVADCTVNAEATALKIENLRFSRGSAREVSIPKLELHLGRVYAVTGANGSGKSTLFGLLTSCGDQATVFPAGLEVHSLDGLELPGGEVVEVGQQLYCPLFTKPLAWMVGSRNFEQLPAEELRRIESSIRSLSSALLFHHKNAREKSVDKGSNGSSNGSSNNNSNNSNNNNSNSNSSSSSSSGQPTATEPELVSEEEIAQELEQAHGIDSEELWEEKQDWYGSLSGGQRVKAELIRKVFMRKSCPKVLLLDEAFAPLDPVSKLQMQRRIKEFCKDSLVLIIYHTDVSRDEPCIEGGFFDGNLHFGNGTASLVKMC